MYLTEELMPPWTMGSGGPAGTVGIFTLDGLPVLGSVPPDLAKAIVSAANRVWRERQLGAITTQMQIDLDWYGVTPPDLTPLDPTK